MDWNEKETILGVKGVTEVTYLIFVICTQPLFETPETTGRLGDFDMP